MKKIFASLVLIVFALSLTIDAQVVKHESYPTKKNVIKSTNDEDFTCSTLSNGLIMCDDLNGYRYYNQSDGKLHSDEYYESAYLETYYYDTSTFTDNPYITKIVYYGYYANKKVEYKQIATLNKKAYNYYSDEYQDGILAFEKYSKFEEYIYSKSGKKTNYSLWQRNSKLIDYKETDYYYFGNGKVKEKWIFFTNNSKKIYKKDYKMYYSSGKLKEKGILLFTAKGIDKKYDRTYYRSNGTKKSATRAYFKAGKLYKMDEYRYNKKGQLKSNKNGNAYKYVYTVNKKGYVVKTMKAKYDKKGKLGKYKQVANKDIIY